MIAAPIASEKVRVMSCLISSRTFVCVVYEMRLPLKTFPIVFAYCT
jgi:hypothetical protein